MNINKSECTHYQNNCLIYAECCNEYYNCKRCHNELNKCNDELSSQNINIIKCKTCNTTQLISNQCTSCDQLFGKYFCTICAIYEDRPRNIFHCDKCNICRVGGKENYFHCDICNCCLSNTLLNNHKCIQNMINDVCCICMEDMFTSQDNAQIFKCSHSMHNSCFQEYCKLDYKCPKCLKSLADMTEYFNKITEKIKETPLPEEMEDIYKNIYCNDCEQKSVVKYHFMGLLCKNCKSYNTAQLE